MKATKLFLAAIAALAFASCQNNGDEFVKPVKANIVGNIGDKALATRAYDATWEDGDAIGLYVSGSTTTISNSSYTTDGELDEQNYVVFSGGPDIEFPSDGSNLTFNAYYPYDKNSITTEDNTPYYNVTNWSGQENLTANKFDPYDLMVAEGVSHNSLNPEVKLTFRHKFSKLILYVDANVDGTKLENGDLNDMVVKATGMNYPVKCDVITGAIKPTRTDQGYFMFKTVSNGEQYEAIICPDEFPNDNSKIVFTLKNGNEFTWKPSLSDNAKFASGNSYIWYLRFNGESIDAQLKATIVNWNPNTIHSAENPKDLFIGDNE